MNLKKEKRDETTASRHMSYLTILGTYMTIFGTVLGLVLSWGQLRLAHIESERPDGRTVVVLFRGCRHPLPV